MSTPDIERYLRELYGVDVGRDLISRVTEAVMDDAGVAPDHAVWRVRAKDHAVAPGEVYNEATVDYLEEIIVAGARGLERWGQPRTAT